MKSPGMYVFHVASFFSAMTSPGMMIGASDLSLLISRVANRRLFVLNCGYEMLKMQTGNVFVPKMFGGLEQKRYLCTIFHESL